MEVTDTGQGITLNKIINISAVTETSAEMISRLYTIVLDVILTQYPVYSK